MFYEWVTAGAAFGISAFFALFVFMLLCAAVVGFIVIVSGVFGGGESDTHKRAH